MAETTTFVSRLSQASRIRARWERTASGGRSMEDMFAGWLDLAGIRATRESRP